MSTFDRYKWYGDRTDAQLASEKYLADQGLATAVNTALAAEQPLLVTGEPGTGKTTLARSIADQLGLEIHTFHTRSDHQSRDLLYSFDHLRRFYDAQSRDARVADLSHYIEFRGLGAAIKSGKECVVLIDEIDKAPRDLPNDLLDVIEKNTFKVDETNEVIPSKARPIVVITSNNERQLPDPFLRRCVFHSLTFPDATVLRRILAAHLKADLPTELASVAIARFEEIRKLPLEKRPATGELLAWMRVLIRAGVPEGTLEAPIAELPHLGALLKTERDLGSARKRA